jgi:hypothetical protein
MEFMPCLLCSDATPHINVGVSTHDILRQVRIISRYGSRIAPLVLWTAQFHNVMVHIELYAF